MAQIEAAGLKLGAVDAGILGGGRNAFHLVVQTQHRPVAELSGGDSKDTRAGADIEQGTPAGIGRGQLEHQGDAEPGAGMSPGAEGLARVDDDLLEPRPGRSGGLPWWANAQRRDLG